MSDDDANAGITLPDNDNATHSIYLSPLFLERSGIQEPIDKLISYAGLNARLWSNTTSTYNGVINALYLTASDFSNTAVRPSVSWRRTYSYSLRCLVSTKRQASE